MGSDRGLLSRDKWIQVNQQRSKPISRASIINFLQDMLDEGILIGSDETGKGGHGTRYSLKYNEQELRMYLQKQVNKKLRRMIDP